MLFAAAAILLASVYLVLQCYYLFYWKKTTALTVPTDYSPTIKFSIIIIARDEANNIENCLRGILAQRYPKDSFEIIVINDRSTDDTDGLVQNLNASTIRLFDLKDFPEFIHPPAFKKSGISLGVHLATHEWIIVCDADCTHGTEWLRTMAYAIETTDHLFLTAPIFLTGQNDMITAMQQTENQAFMVVTAAGIKSAIHDIANGANMAFAKSAFINVNGYEGNYHFASGDDMFLIEKMRQKIGDRIGFVKSYNASAITAAKKTWSSLIKQRLRWAGKNKGLQRPVIRVIWGFVGLYHVALFIFLCLGLLSFISIWPFLILFIPKLLIDFILIKTGTDFLKQKMSVLLFIPLQIVYTFYILWLGMNVMLGKKGDW